MLDKLRSMAIFSKVVELGSFRKAADALDLSASVVSHHVSQLEKQLGTTLLYRSTRYLSLTSAGEELYAFSRSMVQAAEAGLNTIAHEPQELTGRFWIVAPGAFASTPFVTDVAIFARQHPQLDIRLEFDDRPRNMAHEGIDLCIVLGQQPDSSLISRKLFEANLRIVCSPQYLEHHGEPQHPDELQDHDWIAVRAEATLYMSKAGETTREINLRPRMVATSVQATKLLAVGGLGLTTLPRFILEPELETGELKEILPGWVSGFDHCYALFPPHIGKNSATRLFVDYMQVRIEEERERGTVKPLHEEH